MLGNKQRRSESCPRLRKAGTGDDSQVQRQPIAVPVPRTCTLQDLGPEDKQKVAKLLKQVVDMGQELHQLKQQKEEQSKAFAQREQELQDSHSHLQKEHHMLKKKMAQVLLLLRASQAKVNSLEAAGRLSGEAAHRNEATLAPAHLCSTAAAAPNVGAQSEQQQDIITNAGDQSADASLAAGAVAAGQAQPASAGVAPTPAAAADCSGGHSGYPMPSPAMAPLLHVAAGARVSITIHHAPDPAAATGATGPVAGADAASTPTKHGRGPTYSHPKLDAVTPNSADVLQVLHQERPGGHAADPSHGRAAEAVMVLPHARHEPGQVQCDPGGQSSSQACVNGSAPLARAADDARMSAGSGLCYQTASTAATSSSCFPGPRSITVDTTMQGENVPVDEVYSQSQEQPMSSALIVPPTDDVMAAATRLMDWQAQHGFMEPLSGIPRPTTAALDQTSAGRPNAMAGKVLSYDPAIGKHGAFYFVDVPEPEDVSVSMAEMAWKGQKATAGGSRERGPPQRHSGVPNPAGVARLPPAWHLATSSGTATHQNEAQAPACMSKPPGHRGECNLAEAGSCHAQYPLATAPQRHEQQQQQHLRKQAIEQPSQSPCSCAAGSSATATGYTGPARQPDALSALYLSDGGVPTPSSGISLSRMAVVLDEIARRQRWSERPPSSLSAQPRTVQEPELGGPRQLQALGGSHPHSGSSPQVQSTHQQARHPLAHQSGCRGGPPSRTCVPPRELDEQSCCGSSSWLGSDLTDRYDDALVDILSQADEEMELHHQQRLRERSVGQHRHSNSNRPQQQRQQQHPQQQTLQEAPRHFREAPSAGASASTAANGPVPRSSGEANLRASSSAPVLNSTLQLPRQQTPAIQALLAANIYEENDVLSSIFEQENPA